MQPTHLLMTITIQIIDNSWHSHNFNLLPAFNFSHNISKISIGPDPEPQKCLVTGKNRRWASKHFSNPTKIPPRHFLRISLQNQRQRPLTEDPHSLRNTISSIAAIPPSFWSTVLEGSLSTPMAITACWRGEVRPTLMKDMLMFSSPNTEPTFPIMPGWSTCLQSMMLPSRLTSTLKLPTLVRWGTLSLTFPSSVISEVWSGIALANLDATW